MVRTNTAKFLIILKKEKEKSYEWDFLIGIVVEKVLVMLWIDNRSVTMLSTIHTINGEENKIVKERRRPKETSSNSQKVRSVFGNAAHKS